MLLAQGDVDEDNPMVLGDEDEVLPKKIFKGGLLGGETTAPAITDLTQSAGSSAARAGAAIGLVVVYPTLGPASVDLVEAGQPDGRRYHYYVDTSGGVLRLVGETQAARVAGGASWQGRGGVDQRSVAIGVEHGLARLSDEQAAALSWLLRDLQGRYSLAGEQIIQAAELGIGERMPSWEQVLAK
jgi:N-acetylmuramoyl-L-alanine amidase